MVPPIPGPPGKMAIKPERERERERVILCWKDLEWICRQQEPYKLHVTWLYVAVVYLLQCFTCTSSHLSRTSSSLRTCVRSDVGTRLVHACTRAHLKGQHRLARTECETVYYAVYSCTLQCECTLTLSSFRCRCTIDQWIGDRAECICNFDVINGF